SDLHVHQVRRDVGVPRVDDGRLALPVELLLDRETLRGYCARVLAEAVGLERVLRVAFVARWTALLMLERAALRRGEALAARQLPARRVTPQEAVERLRLEALRIPAVVDLRAVVTV